MIEELKSKIKSANKAYREGDAIMSDKEWDSLVEKLAELSPDDELLSEVGHSIDKSRKVKLPIEMSSMNKIKSMEDLSDWSRLRNIPTQTIVIITPKYDGLSLCVNELEDSAFTRGDGTFGQKSDKHYSLISNHLNEVDSFIYTYGEVMMSKKTFLDKYSSDFANPRNLVAGLLNSKEASESLKDCDYIKYGAIPSRNIFQTKKQILDKLNSGQRIKVPYHISKLSELTEEVLLDLFKEYSVEYEIDGLIIEVNDLNQQLVLGRETSTNNPTWARAFKHINFEQSESSIVTGISWNISKQGYLKPIIHINPIQLDGVTVSNVTGNNARYIKEMGIGVGSEVKVVRSGMVIPKVVEVIKQVDFVMPSIGVDIEWNEAGIELITLNETDDQKLKKLISFFEILESDNVSEGVITQLWEAGHKTIKDILSLTKEDLEKIDRFGKRKAKIVYDSIQKSVTGVQLSKLQHASNLFFGLGSRKLCLLEHFGYENKPNKEVVLRIDGFAEISASSYMDGFDNFREFIKDLPITILEIVEVEKTSSELEGKSFCFTGLRRKDIESIIESKGGKIGGSVNRRTNYLTCKDPGSGSSKLTKAQDLGVILLSIDELEKMLGLS